MPPPARIATSPSGERDCHGCPARTQWIDEAVFTAGFPVCRAGIFGMGDLPSLLEALGAGASLGNGESPGRVVAGGIGPLCKICETGRRSARRDQNAAAGGGPFADGLPAQLELAAFYLWGHLRAGRPDEPRVFPQSAHEYPAGVRGPEGETHPAAGGCRRARGVRGSGFWVEPRARAVDRHRPRGQLRALRPHPENYRRPASPGFAGGDRVDGSRRHRGPCGCPRGRIAVFWPYTSHRRPAPRGRGRHDDAPPVV